MSAKDASGKALNDKGTGDAVLVCSTLDDGVLQICMNRPDALNALTQPLMNQLRARLELAAREPDVRVVVLTGAGRAFCAGADRFAGAEPDLDDPFQARWSDDERWRERDMRTDRLRFQMEAARLLYAMPKPTLAVIRGAAVGAGLSLAAACDLRLASTTALFRAGFANAAYSGDYGCAFLLARLIGPGKTRELMMLDDKLDARAALACGLVNWVVDDDELERRALTLAQRLAAGPPIAYRYMKRNFGAVDELGFAAYLDLEAQNMLLSATTDDATEARTAFK